MINKNSLLLIFIFIANIILFAITLEWCYLIFIFILVIIFTKKKIKYSKSFIMIFVLIIFSPLYEGKENTGYKHQGTVFDTTENGLWIKEDKDNYFVMTNKKEGIERNDEVSFSCFYIEGEYEFGLYLKSHFTKYYCYGQDLKITKEGKKINNHVKNYIKADDGKTSEFLDYLLFNETSQNTNDIIKNLGIYHLFVVSGFHISIFIKSLNKFSSKILHKEHVLTETTSILFSIPFILVTGASIPVMRAFLYEIMLFLNRWFLDAKYTNVEVISFLGILFLFYNPFFVFNASFILTFSIVIFINLIPIKRRSALNVNATAFFISLPTIMSFNPTVNLLAIPTTMLLTPLIVPGIVISCFVVFIPSVWFIFDIYFLLIWKAILLLNTFYIPVFIFSKIKNISCIIFSSLIIISFLWNNKKVKI